MATVGGVAANMAGVVVSAGGLAVFANDVGQIVVQFLKACGGCGRCCSRFGRVWDGCGLCCSSYGCAARCAVCDSVWWLCAMLRQVWLFGLW